MPPDPLGILLASGTHEQAHLAFSLAATAAALGRPTFLFATNRGCLALTHTWQELDPDNRDATLQARGAPGLETLRIALVDLGVRLMACETGLIAEAIDPATLLPGVEIAGLASFLHDVGAGQIVPL